LGVILIGKPVSTFPGSLRPPDATASIATRANVP
jgi:hypothetical protein